MSAPEFYPVSSALLCAPFIAKQKAYLLESSAMLKNKPLARLPEQVKDPIPL